MICQPDWYTYLNQLQTYISAQSKKIQQLEQSIAQLRKELEQLKKSPSTNVERIEYKFDQLKIETLEGTLNIGLNPSDLNSLGQFTVDQSVSTPSTASPKQQQILGGITDKVNRYLDEECFELLQRLEAQHNRSLGEPFHSYIIEDVRKQITPRIAYYISQNAEKLNSEESEACQEMIYQKVREDIEKSFAAFINNMPTDIKGGTFNEFHGD